MHADPLETFGNVRPLMFSIAYRMLGTVMDAEDMVQETFIRWQRSDQTKIESPQAWLSTVVTRLCINHLKSARVQRETYVGPWLPEPLVAGMGVDPRENAKLSESLSLAFLVLLENLSPTERAVFLLREVFEYDFADIALIVEKTESNCRQILTRARKSVGERRPKFDVSLKDAEELIHQFDQALLTGDLEKMLCLLAKDVVLISDGGGKGPAVLRPIYGADHVSRGLIGAAKRLGNKTRVLQHATVNGLPGSVIMEDGRPIRVLAYDIRDGRIQGLYAVTNPDKLRHLADSSK